MIQHPGPLRNNPAANWPGLTARGGFVPAIFVCRLTPRGTAISQETAAASGRSWTLSLESFSFWYQANWQCHTRCGHTSAHAWPRAARLRAKHHPLRL